MNKPSPSDIEKNKEIKSNISSGLILFIKGSADFLFHSMNMSEGADKARIVSGITKDISFRGHAAWILVCSILIASIGLNLNSTAVIIGAMLISPLMGPILGIGLGVGIYDRDLLMDSLRNFALAVIISLIASSFYFWVSPLKVLTPEMLSRTNPSILDAMIALFGGLAGIIAVSRKEISNAIPGVAIATALMPPLCTAGYGISIWDAEIFWEAFYLFFLNSVLIFIPTLIVIRYLGLPTKLQLDKKTEKRVKAYILGFVLIIILPSAYIFWGMIQKSLFERDAKEFVAEHFEYRSVWITNEPKYKYSDEGSSITINFNDNVISPIDEKELKLKLIKSIPDCELLLIQPSDKTDEIAGKLSQEVKVGILEEIYEKNDALLQNKEDRIRLLEEKVVEAEKVESLIEKLNKMIDVSMTSLDEYIIAEAFKTDSTGEKKRHPIIMVKWNKQMNSSEKNKEADKLLGIAKLTLEDDGIELIEF